MNEKQRRVRRRDLAIRIKRKELMLKLSGKILRKRREKLGISGGQIARHTGRDLSTISRYENGHRDTKNLESAVRLLEAYGYKIIDTLDEA